MNRPPYSVHHCRENSRSRGSLGKVQTRGTALRLLPQCALRGWQAPPGLQQPSSCPAHTQEAVPGAALAQEFADSVYHIIAQKFQELTDNFASIHARHKSLAGIVMTRAGAASAATLVDVQPGSAPASHRPRTLSVQSSFGLRLANRPEQVESLDIRQAQVIVLTSGTKCINGEYINDRGLVVNDCHAEIVARRAFTHFLYSQLELHLSDNV
ncbi:hypothetical protein lerEdw1_019234 [Lerista edwardsae]|nr:hypothetical protein lerEdw1_019234 [Lerista edwardsae]